MDLLPVSFDFPEVAICKALRNRYFSYLFTISSQPRYDHFDNSPCFVNAPIIPHFIRLRNHLFTVQYSKNTIRNRGGFPSKKQILCHPF